ncbi:MAG: hypothetical protein ACK4GR_02890 [bacterium]
MKKNLIKFLILANIIWMITLIVQASENESMEFSFAVGGQGVDLKTARASFSFIAPNITLNTKINPKFNLLFNYSEGKDSVPVGNDSFGMKWKQWGGSFDYKILNDDKSLWVSLLYREFGIKSTWRNEVDEDSWKGIGLGLSFRPKIKENLYGKIGINYFPSLKGNISNYKNFEVMGQVEYVLKNNKNSLLLHYTNQNLTSLTQNIGDIKVNQLGISFKTKF